MSTFPRPEDDSDNSTNACLPLKFLPSWIQQNNETVITLFAEKICTQLVAKQNVLPQELQEQHSVSLLQVAQTVLRRRRQCMHDDKDFIRPDDCTCFNE